MLPEELDQRLFYALKDFRFGKNGVDSFTDQQLSAARHSFNPRHNNEGTIND